MSDLQASIEPPLSLARQAGQALLRFFDRRAQAFADQSERDAHFAYFMLDRGDARLECHVLSSNRCSASFNSGYVSGVSASISALLAKP